jgi:hypothetical protein
MRIVTLLAWFAVASCAQQDEAADGAPDAPSGDDASVETPEDVPDGAPDAPPEAEDDAAVPDEAGPDLPPEADEGGRDDAPDVREDVADEARPDDAPDVREDAADDGPPPPAPTLVISELDYDQPSADDREFVELYNYGSAPASCTGLELVLVNGGAAGGPAEYHRQALTCTTIAAGGFHLIGDAAFLDVVSCPSKEPLDDPPGRFENGEEDVVALWFAPAGVWVDQVAYDGDVPVPGWGEGLPAPSDRATGDESIQRSPAGHDTDDNSADFACLTPSTPCTDPP